MNLKIEIPVMLYKQGADGEVESKLLNLDYTFESEAEYKACVDGDTPVPLPEIPKGYFTTPKEAGQKSERYAPTASLVKKNARSASFADLEPVEEKSEEKSKADTKPAK